MSGASTPGNAPRVSVIIPNYKRPELLRKAVLSLFRQDLDPRGYEIIVVDSSPDDSATSVLAELAPQAPCELRWFTKTAEGPGPSRNLGAREARGEFLAFTDNDCQGAPGWLREGIAAFDDNVGVVQGQTQPDPAGRRGVFSHYILVEQESHLYETCNIFYRRQAFEDAGGFVGRDLTPTAIAPMGGEDIDLAWRVKRQGWASRFAPQAVVYHEVVPLSPWRWLFSKSLFIFPLMVKRTPELRRHMWGRYFYDRAQACFLLLLLGVILASLHWAGLILALPYVAVRASEATATLRGPLRLLRVAVYFARDAVSFVVLAAGSLRFRSLLL